MKTFLSVLIPVLSLVFSCQSPERQSSGYVQNGHAVTEINADDSLAPSGSVGGGRSEAGSAKVNADDYLEIPVFDCMEPNFQRIEHYAFTIGYRKDWKIPRWVAYELTSDETYGDVGRKNHFIPDPELDIEASAVNDDYKNNGRRLDRGHMAPAADMKWSEKAMEESFYFSNVCPQNHNLNCGDWCDLEKNVREWARQFGNIYIVCGPVVHSQNHDVIGRANVTVPDAFFKVLLVKAKRGWQAIGFFMKNEAGSRNLGAYAVSIDEVEEITGMDFFSQLEDEIENHIERNFNLRLWNLR